jgi:hypothetical protein
VKKLASILLNPLFLAVLLIGIESCKKNGKDNVVPTNPGSAGEKINFALQGDGFSNQSFVINSGSTNTVALGGYNAADNYTGIGIAGNISATKSISTVIVFRGKSTGQFAMGPDEHDDEAYMTLLVKDGSTEKMYVSMENAGTLKVTSYENVGGKIEGTFSGTLTHLDISSGTPSTVTVSNLKFGVARIADELQ